MTDRKEDAVPQPEEGDSSANATKQQPAPVETTRHDRTTARLVGFIGAAWKHVRLALPALVASFLLSVLVLVRPVSDWMGPFAFLVFFHLHLFFFPSPLTVGENIQSSLLGLLGSLVGCGVGLLIVSCGLWIDGDQQPEPRHLRYTPYATNGSRAFAACALILVSFLNGLLSSAVPRFKNFSRICLFNLSWIITRGSVDRTTNYKIFSEFFHPSVISAGVGILANILIFPRSGHSVFTEQLLNNFELIGKLVDDSTKLFFTEQYTSRSRQEIVDLRTKFTAAVARLALNFEAASAEVALVRIPVSAYGPLIKALQRSRGWIASGVEVEVDEERTSPGAGGLTELEGPVRALAVETKQSFDLIRVCLLSFEGRQLDPESPLFGSDQSELLKSVLEGDIKADPGLAHRAILQQRHDLTAAVDRLRHELQTVLDVTTPQLQELSASATTFRSSQNVEANRHSRTGSITEEQAQLKPSHTIYNNRMYAASYLILCLIEIAQACLHALITTQNLLRLWSGTTRRHIQWPWTTLHGSQLSMSAGGWRRWASRADPGTLNDMLGSMRVEKYGLETDDPFDEDGVKSKSEVAEAERKEKETEKHRRRDLGGEPEKGLSSGHSRFNIFAEADHTIALTSSRTSSSGSKTVRAPTKASKWQAVRRAPSILLRLWRTKEVIIYRVRLSNALRSLKESRHIRFGIKLSIGCLILTIPAWLPAVGAREWWYGERGQWALISYVWCLETSTGATVRVSTFRMIGTCAGAIYGYLIWVICRSNPYGIAFFIVLAELFSAYMMLETTAQGIGVVFALTFPIVALIPYLNLSTSSVAILAWERGFMVTIGIALALVVNLAIWPFHARVQLVLQIARATGRLQRLYLSLSRQMLNTDLVTTRHTRKAFEQLERSILKTLAQSRSLIALMSVEVSLAPKPTVLLGKIINHLSRIADLLVGLRLCREHAMKGKLHAHLVLNVLENRTELISAILISFFAVGASVRNRTPLPQFLPSARTALEELTLSLHEQLSQHDARGTATAGTSTPDAFHALSSLYGRRPGWRRQHSNSGRVSRSRSPTHHTPDGSLTPVRASTGLTSSHTHTLLQSAIQRNAMGTTTNPVPPPKLAHFFALAEHSLLAQIVSELEHLLELTRRLVGTATVLEMAFDLPSTVDDSPHSGVHSTFHSGYHTTS
ncbi:hypothetical protein CF319_g4363 [Tilletia indica]|nr:hypothetical protein CF319_g4363 [Tilletia indica]